MKKKEILFNSADIFWVKTGQAKLNNSKTQRYPRVGAFESLAYKVYFLRPHHLHPILPAFFLTFAQSPPGFLFSLPSSCSLYFHSFSSLPLFILCVNSIRFIFTTSPASAAYFCTLCQASRCVFTYTFCLLSWFCSLLFPRLSPFFHPT